MFFIRIPGRRWSGRRLRARPRRVAGRDATRRTLSRGRRLLGWKYVGFYGVGIVVFAYLVIVSSLISEEIPILSPAGGWATPWGGVLGNVPAGDESSTVGPAADDDFSDCGTPGVPDEKLYGQVAEEELPWFSAPPRKLVERRLELGAPPMIVAFRTTLPDPILQEVYNVGVAAGYLAGTVVGPGEVFSLNPTIGPPTREKGYGDGPTYVGGRIVPSVAGGICKISSTLYNAVVLSGLDVVERHPHSMLVPYVPPGRDATISYGGKNFRFRNSETVPVLMWAERLGHTLYIAFYADFDPPQVQWEQKELARQQTWTTRRANPSLPSGEERVVVEGYDGVTVQTWVTTTYPDRPPKRRDFGVDYYRPMPRVVEYGP